MPRLVSSSSKAGLGERSHPISARVSSLTPPSRITQIRRHLSVRGPVIKAACSLATRWLIIAQTVLEILDVSVLAEFQTEAQSCCHCSLIVHSSIWSLRAWYPALVTIIVMIVVVVLLLRLCSPRSHRSHEKTSAQKTFGTIVTSRTTMRAGRRRAFVATSFGTVRLG